VKKKLVAVDQPPIPTLAERDSNLMPSDDDPATIAAIADHVGAILELLRLDLSDHNLAGTPQRVAKMYLEMFHGLKEGAEPQITTFPNEENYSAMVTERDIPFYSMCAHHLVPFYGHAHIAYIPKKNIVGLSKLPRILEFYAKRPQIQERLTEQVADLEPASAGAVVIEAAAVSAASNQACHVTSAIRGCFDDRKVRAEFLAFLGRTKEW
jgi:GTP cyclohydrolase I